MVKILSRDELQAASCGLMKIACMALTIWANHTVQTMSSRCTPTPRTERRRLRVKIGPLSLTGGGDCKFLFNCWKFKIECAE